MIIVADAGPLLHLFWVGASSWALPSQTIDVVEEVWQEVHSHAPAALRDSRLRRVVPPTRSSIDLSPWRLDGGERAALAYALSQRSDQVIVVLCDEREARRACTELSLPVVGSVGLIAEAFEAGKVALEAAEAALRELPGRGRLHVQPELIELALSALRAS